MHWNMQNFPMSDVVSPDFVCYRGEAAISRYATVLPLLGKAITRANGQLTLAVVYGGLETRKLQLWVDATGKTEMVAVTAITQYPEIRVLAILLVGGSGISSWHNALVERLTVFAKANQCTALEAAVRRSLIGASYREDKAILKGWNKLTTLVRKPI